jgi:hypothetical protein
MRDWQRPLTQDKIAVLQEEFRVLALRYHPLGSQYDWVHVHSRAMGRWRPWENA